MASKRMKQTLCQKLNSLFGVPKKPPDSCLKHQIWLFPSCKVGERCWIHSLSPYYSREAHTRTFAFVSLIRAAETGWLSEAQGESFPLGCSQWGSAPVGGARERRWGQRKWKRPISQHSLLSNPSLGTRKLPYCTPSHRNSRWEKTYSCSKWNLNGISRTKKIR